jgi:hypothetical protein
MQKNEVGGGGWTTYGRDGICIERFGRKPNEEDHFHKKNTYGKITEKCRELGLDGVYVLYFASVLRLMPITVARVLRHELSTPSQTLGSSVRIPLQAWICLCLFCVCVVLWRQRPFEGLILCPRRPTDCLRYIKTEVKRSVSRMPYAPDGTPENMNE